MATPDDDNDVGSGSSKDSKRRHKSKTKPSQESVSDSPSPTQSSKKSKTAKSTKKKKRTPSTAQDDADTTGAEEKKIRKVQVKQKSASSLPVAGSTSTTSGDAASVVAPTTPAAGGEPGFAGYYGMMIESKRVEELCRSLALEKRHVASLLRAFKREEQLGTGEITTGEFFTLVKEIPRQLTNGLFEYIGLPGDTRRLRFDDFVWCVATVATWTKSELFHYAFKQFDVDDSGVMDGRELRAFCEGLRSDSSFYFSKNVDTARQKLASRDRHPNHHYTDKSGQVLVDTDADANTLVDLTDLADGAKDFQVAFYPLMQFQQNIRECALGDRFWAAVTHRKQQVEGIVRYMNVHKGKLPPVSLLKRIIAQLMPFSKAHAELVVHEMAVLKHAKDQRLLQEQAHARAQAEALALTEIQEEQ